LSLASFAHGQVVGIVQVDNHTASSDGMVEQGLTIGAKVQLMARRTVELGPKKIRKDIPKGYESTIKGFVDGKVLITFTCSVNGKELSQDVSFKPDVLVAVAATSASSSSSSQKASGKCLAGLEFLGDQSEFELVSKWSKKQTSEDEDFSTMRKKDTVGFTLRALGSALPEYNEEECMARPWASPA